MKIRLVTTVALCFLFGIAMVYAQVPTPPPIPQNLVAAPVPNNPGAVKLTWEAPLGQWAYRVYRSIDDTSHFIRIAMTPQRTFTNFGLMPGHTYYYAVTSVVFQNNHVVESPRSNVVSFSVTPPPPRPKGVIAGTVTDDSTGLPIRCAHIRFFRLPAPTNMTPHVYTDSLGHYSARLDTGVYLVKAEAMSPTPHTPPYIPEWYDNAPDPSTATPVAVAESSLFVANFGLSRLAPPTFAYVSGTVTDTLGNPLRGASVVFMRPVQEMAASEGLAEDTNLDEATTLEGFGYVPGVVWRGRTDSLGNYRARVISGRSYIAMANKLGYLPEFYNNKATATDADVIVVNGDVTGINFSLALNPAVQNSISGLVRDSLGTPAPSRIILFPLRNTPAPTPWHVRYGHTDSLGAYTINNVLTGRYFVLAVPFRIYAPAFYKAGAYGVIRWQDADTVNVSGAVTGINIGVKRIHSPGIAQIRGRVQATNGLPVEGVHVFAFTGNAIAGYGMTDGSGNYTLNGLPLGRMQVIVDREGYNSSETTLDVTSFSHGNVNFVLSSPAVLFVGDGATPSRFALEQNYPNPFNPTTTISFWTPVVAPVSLTVYNMIGQEVARLVHEVMPAGNHSVTWSGEGLPSGVYLYRLIGSGITETRKMVLMK